MTPRTYLFVPGDRPERFAKALASGADAVVLDLEDAVAPAAKAAAREAVAQWCRTAPADQRARTGLRLNDAAAPGFADDLRLLATSGLAWSMLSKAESPAQVAAVRSRGGGLPVLALIESARGVHGAHEIAAAPGVARLVFGTLDFAADLGIAPEPEGLAHAAAVLVLASRLAGLPPPVAGVSPDLQDEARLLADLAASRRLGFGAKLCIHPRQVAPVHRALQPTAAELAWADRVLAAAAAAGGAAVQMDGRMVDAPVVLQARALRERAGLGAGDIAGIG